MSTSNTIVALLAWYIFNGLFNVENKLILNQLHYPWIVSWVQLATGILVAVPVWMLGLRRTPIVDQVQARMHAWHGYCRLGTSQAWYSHFQKSASVLMRKSLLTFLD